MSAAGDVPAFPLPLVANMRANPDSIGLTKRELFAAMAPPYPFKMPQVSLYDKRDVVAQVTEPLANWSVAWADALIAELAK